MSLATRCTACGTVFRVVQDQLKVSEGWVRCGRCKEVFNALEGLFDLEPVSQRTPLEGEPADAAAAPASAARSEASLGEGEAVAASLELAAGGAEGPSSRHEDEAAEDSTDFADARFPSELPLDSTGELLPSEAPAIEAEPGSVGTDTGGAVATADPADDDTPSFLRPADAPARWERPRMRLALGGTALLLALVLALQWTLHFRDALAAEHPGLAPMLAAACNVLGCRIEPPHRIEDVAIESSALARAPQGSAYDDALQLSVALRNRGTLALAPPFVDLSLTDANGQLVARRALPASAFRGAGPLLPPAGEVHLQLLLANPGGRVAGYTVAVFYP